MKRTLLALALIASAGAAHAQMTAEPTDPYGRPLIGRNDWVRQPGDQGAANAGANMGANMATAPATRSAAPYAAPMQSGPMQSGPMRTRPMQSGPREATFKDEYGFRYDAEGNRLDARGNIISPQTR